MPSDQIQPAENKPHFVGSETCIDCHKTEYDLWHGSDHYNAMDTASEASVLGDFNDVLFESKGIQSRFFRSGVKFMVHTQGPDGKFADFEIKYTFGVRPLQQYLIPFEGGRLQCLPLAWDTEKNEWFDLVEEVYAGQDIPPDDWLHWTNLGQNWNGMCAECHTTRLVKNYNAETLEFQTNWFEINVACESCHGPSSAHLEWAQLPEMARQTDNYFGLVTQTSGINNREYVDLCARCHARRQSMGDHDHFVPELLDLYIPQLITEPYYFIDGQILEEDYVYGSFTQSKMYVNGVQCNDCHGVHDMEFVKEGNDLCYQCHRPEEYNRFSHHFHKQKGEVGVALEFEDITYEVGEGALCINCHMAGRYYMGVDLRRDHSFRIPRPDLSLSLGVPNACNDCHQDKTAEWANDYYTQWYGASRKQHFGQIFALGQEGDPDALHPLIEIVKAPEELYTFIIRATALSFLVNYNDETAYNTIINSLTDPEPLVRYTAVRIFFQRNAGDLIQYLAPLLNDPVRAVRQEAASKLAIIPEDQLKPELKNRLGAVIEEYFDAMIYTADFAASRHNLGNLFHNLGQHEPAIKHYREAIVIDKEFYPSKINLATLYNQSGRNEEAEKLFKDVIQNYPDIHRTYYLLGLLLAEENKFEEATIYLEKASELMSDNARIFYNLGLIYQRLQNYEKAKKALTNTLVLEPDNPDYIYAVAYFFVQSRDYENALIYTDQLLERFPDNPTFNELKILIENEMGQKLIRSEE